MKGLVYMATNRINGKSYIGQTTRPFDDRIKEHLKCRGNCTILICAIRKYGHEAFWWKILRGGIESQEELNRIEEQMIALHETTAPHGYNLKQGGAKGRLTKEAREHISEGLKKKAQDPNWIAKLKAWKRDGSRVSAGLKRLYSDPAKRAMLCPGKQKMAHDPDWLAKRKAGAIRTAKDPVWLAKRRAAQKRIWQNPEYRERQIRSLHSNWNDPVYRAKRSEIMRALWTKPEYRARQSKSRRRTK